MTRTTRQRTLIRDVLQQALRPLSPSEILEQAHATQPQLGIATVYRTLKLLLEDGEITNVLLPGEPARYEPARKGHHHHFSCQNCRRVLELEGCALKADRMVPPGSRVLTHDVILYGICADCNTSKQHAKS